MAGKPSNYCNNHQWGVSYTLGTVTGASYRIPKTLSGDKYPPFKVKPELRRSNKLPKVRELRSEFQAHSPGPFSETVPTLLLHAALPTVTASTWKPHPLHTRPHAAHEHRAQSPSQTHERVALESILHYLVLRFPTQKNERTSKIKHEVLHL